MAVVDADRVEADILADEVFELGGIDLPEPFEAGDGSLGPIRDATAWRTIMAPSPSHPFA